jgi:hypothetical protein
MGTVARGIANVPLLVCDPRTWREHPQLFHYTGEVAFGSIVRSNSFWASHYRDMKDKTEVLRLRTALPPAIAARFDEIVATFKMDRTARRLWKKEGRGLGTARDFVNSLYGASFDKKAPTGLDAFVTSFSTQLIGITAIILISPDPARSRVTAGGENSCNLREGRITLRSSAAWRAEPPSLRAFPPVVSAITVEPPSSRALDVSPGRESPR